MTVDRVVMADGAYRRLELAKTQAAAGLAQNLRECQGRKPFGRPAKNCNNAATGRL